MRRFSGLRAFVPLQLVVLLSAAGCDYSDGDTAMGDGDSRLPQAIERCRDADASTPCVWNAFPVEIEPGVWDATATRALSGQGIASALPANTVAQHPWLLAGGRNGTHADAYASGSYHIAGPRGINPVVSSAIAVDFWRDQSPLALAGECLTQTFSSDGSKLYSLCADFGVFKLLSLDIENGFRRSGILTQPERNNPGEALIEQARDSSGGVYFHAVDLGAGEQILTVNGDERIQLISPTGAPDPGDGSDFGFTVVEEWDVKPYLQVSEERADASKLTDVMVDWQYPNLIWFIAKDGTVGLLDRNDGSVETLVLSSLPEGPDGDLNVGVQQVIEQIQNSVAMDEQGLYVVSDFALYRFSAEGESGGIIQDWRSSNYERGGAQSGTFSQGSGTTPTAFGPDYIAITDFADPINVVVYSRASGDEICRQPVFKAGASATENSLIGYFNAGVGSVIVENNFGYGLNIDPLDQLPVLEAAPGVARIDVTGGAQGGQCALIWDRAIVSPSAILKLSTGSGIIYFVEPEYGDGNRDGVRTADETAWYLTGLDFITGAVEFRVFIGTGKQWNVNYAAVSIGPDGRAYFGSIRGLVAVSDGY